MKRHISLLALLLAVMMLAACSQTPDSAVRLVSGTGTTAQKDNDGSTVMDFGSLGGVTSLAAPVVVNNQTYSPRENIVNILLIGVDKDENRREVGRADMVMLVTLDFDAGMISCLTIPRDTHTTVRHLDDAGNVTGEVLEKINHAYAYGLGPNKYSAENTMQCASDFLSIGGKLDVPVNYYISIDLDGLADLADVFGGIQVTLDQDMPWVGSAGETVNLTGITVRHYLENRHDMDDGEVTRQLHEQTFLKALLEEIKDVGAVRNAGQLYTIFTKFVRTNLTLQQVLAYAQILDTVALGDISFDRVSGTGTTVDGVWYLEPDLKETEQLVLKSQYRQA